MCLLGILEGGPSLLDSCLDLAARLGCKGRPLEKLVWILSPLVCPKSQEKKDQLDRHR